MSRVAAGNYQFSRFSFQKFFKLQFPDVAASQAGLKTAYCHFSENCELNIDHSSKGVSHEPAIT